MHFRANFKNILKSCQGVDKEYLRRSKTSQEISKSVIKKKAFEIWKKLKSQKLKKNIFDSPLLINQTFPQT